MVYCKIHFSAVYGVSSFAIEICGLICCNPSPNNYPCASVFSIVRQCKSPWYLFRFCSSTADAQISLIWCFLLGALQFMIRMVERAYLDWNYPFVHRRSPSPWRELPWEPVPVPTSDLRAEARRLQPAAAIRSRGPDPNKIADFYAVFHAHAPPSPPSVILPMHMCMYLKHIQHTYGLIYVYVYEAHTAHICTHICTRYKAIHIAYARAILDTYKGISACISMYLYVSAFT